MQLQIQGKNLDINDNIRNHVNQKLGQIGRHLPGITRASVELASEDTRSQRDRVVVQVTLQVSGTVLRAEQRAPNTRAAINAVAEVLSRRIERFKGQDYRSERARRGPSLGDQNAEEANPTADSDEG